MYRVEPFTEEHWRRIAARQWEKSMIESGGERHDLAGIAALKGPAFTGFYKEDIVAIGGVTLLWQGVGEAWIVGSELVGAHWRFFAKNVRRRLAAIEREHKLHRVQATVQCGVPGLIRFIEFCGLSFEARLSRYGPDCGDYLLYSKVAQ